MTRKQKKNNLNKCKRTERTVERVRARIEKKSKNYTQSKINVREHITY